MTLQMESLFSAALNTWEEAAYFNLIQDHFSLLSLDGSTTDLKIQEMPLSPEEGEAERQKRWEKVCREFEAMAANGPNEKNVRGFLGTLYAGTPSQMLEIMIAQAGYTKVPSLIDSRPDSRMNLSGTILWTTTDPKGHVLHQQGQKLLEGALVEVIKSIGASCVLSFSMEYYSFLLAPQNIPEEPIIGSANKTLFIDAGQLEISCWEKKKKIPV